MEVDHIFICTKYGAPEAQVLTDFGFVEGTGNTHTGQGTKNRRFFFENMFIELIWLENQEEAQSSITKPTFLYERLTKNLCPFGICFRPSSKKLNFKTWHYQPDYLPNHLAIQIAKNNLLTEPMWFYADFLSCSNRKAPKIESMTVILPDLHLIPNSNLKIVKGDEYLLSIKLKDNNQIYDCRPTLPLIFN